MRQIFIRGVSVLVSAGLLFSPLSSVFPSDQAMERETLRPEPITESAGLEELTHQLQSSAELSPDPDKRKLDLQLYFYDRALSYRLPDNFQELIEDLLIPLLAEQNSLLPAADWRQRLRELTRDLRPYGPPGESIKSLDYLDRLFDRQLSATGDPSKTPSTVKVFIPKLVRWIQAYVLLPQGVALARDMSPNQKEVRRILLIPINGYELYRDPKNSAQAPYPIVYSNANPGAMRGGSHLGTADLLLGTGYVCLQNTIEKTETATLIAGRLRETSGEELSHIYDNDRSFWKLLKPSGRFQEDALVLPWRLRMSKLLELRADLRGLVGDGAEHLRQKLIRTFEDKLPLDPKNPHHLSERWLVQQLFGSTIPTLAELQDRAPNLWQREFMDPLEMQLARIYPATPAEAETQMQRLVSAVRTSKQIRRWIPQSGIAVLGPEVLRDMDFLDFLQEWLKNSPDPALLRRILFFRVGKKEAEKLKQWNRDVQVIEKPESGLASVFDHLKALRENDVAVLGNPALVFDLRPMAPAGTSVTARKIPRTPKEPATPAGLEETERDFSGRLYFSDEALAAQVPQEIRRFLEELVIPLLFRPATLSPPKRQELMNRLCGVLLSDAAKRSDKNIVQSLQKTLQSLKNSSSMYFLQTNLIPWIQAYILLPRGLALVITEPSNPTELKRAVLFPAIGYELYQNADRSKIYPLAYIHSMKGAVQHDHQGKSLNIGVDFGGYADDVLGTGYIQHPRLSARSPSPEFIGSPRARLGLAYLGINSLLVGALSDNHPTLMSLGAGFVLLSAAYSLFPGVFSSPLLDGVPEQIAFFRRAADEELSHLYDGRSFMLSGNPLREAQLKPLFLKFSVKFRSSFLAELRADLRELLGPHPEILYEKLHQIYLARSTPNPASPHRVSEHWIVEQLFGPAGSEAPTLPQLQARIPALWQREFRDPLQMPLRRTYPTTEEEADAQLQRLAELTAGDWTISLEEYFARNQAALASKGVQGEEAAIFEDATLKTRSGLEERDFDGQLYFSDEALAAQVPQDIRQFLEELVIPALFRPETLNPNRWFEFLSLLEVNLLERARSNEVAVQSLKSIWETFLFYQKLPLQKDPLSAAASLRVKLIPWIQAYILLPRGIALANDTPHDSKAMNRVILIPAIGYELYQNKNRPDEAPYPVVYTHVKPGTLRFSTSNISWELVPGPDGAADYAMDTAYVQVPKVGMTKKQTISDILLEIGLTGMGVGSFALGASDLPTIFDDPLIPIGVGISFVLSGVGGSIVSVIAALLKNSISKPMADLRTIVAEELCHLYDGRSFMLSGDTLREAQLKPLLLKFPVIFRSSFLAELRADLRELLGPHPEILYEKLHQIYLDRLTPNPASPHQVSEHWIVEQLFGPVGTKAPTLPELQARIPALWQREFRDPLQMPLQRTYPATEEEAAAQLQRLAKLGAEDSAASLKKYLAGNQVAQVSEGVQGPGIAVFGYAALETRAGLEELVTWASPDLLKRMVFFGVGKVWTDRLRGLNPDVQVIDDFNRVELTTWLLGIPEADRVTVVGDVELAGYLQHVLPRSMAVIPLAADAAFRFILEAMGVSPLVLQQIDASGLEEQLARSQAA